MSQIIDLDPWDDPWPNEPESTSTNGNDTPGSPSRVSIPTARRSLVGKHAVHPLEGKHVDRDEDEQSDVSRPTLRRLTSETERQVAELAESSKSAGASQSSGSNRGSLDLLRMTPTEGSSEVEVLVHHIKPSESLAGIALLYGIDLPTLRKINKLWASDSVHLRTHLYVPIEACKWNKASETFVRGPGPGQITLVPKTSSNRKGKTPIRSPQATSPFDETSNASGSSNGWGDLDDWAENSPAKAFMSSTNTIYERESMDSIRPTLLERDSDEPEQRIVDVVRIPNSQLRFFPRPQKPPDGRRSLEQDMRRVSLEREIRRSTSMRQAGPSISNDLSTLPPPYQPDKPPPQPKSNFVKIRPNTSSSTSLASSISTTAIADRITSFFTIPPPPSQYSTMPTLGKQKSRPKLSMDFGGGNSASSSRRSSAVSTPVNPDIPLEIRPHRPKPNGKPTNKKLD